MSKNRLSSLLAICMPSLSNCQPSVAISPNVHHASLSATNARIRFHLFCRPNLHFVLFELFFLLMKISIPIVNQPTDQPIIRAILPWSPCSVLIKLTNHCHHYHSHLTNNHTNHSHSPNQCIEIFERFFSSKICFFNGLCLVSNGIGWGGSEEVQPEMPLTFVCLYNGVSGFTSSTSCSLLILPPGESPISITCSIPFFD